MAKKKKRVGRSELIDFPELGFKSIPAKIDTGAFTSSVAFKSAKERKIKGEHILEIEFDEVFYSRRRTQRKFHFLEFEKKVVKNSFGNSEERYLVETNVRIFGEAYNTEFTLGKRTNMKFPVLLGRKFLESRFFVDVSYINLSYRKKLNKKK